MGAMMTNEKPPHDVELVMQSVIAKTCDYFETEHGLRVTAGGVGGGKLAAPTLLDLTAMIRLGGLVNLLAVFSFQASLVNAVYEWMTVGFQDRPEEVEAQREAAIGELVNTVLGHCTIDLQHLDRAGISMTPPVILDRTHVFPEMNSTVLGTHCLNSVYGRLTISLVGLTNVGPASPDHPR